jgi:carboxyl-terminal processing protease
MNLKHSLFWLALTMSMTTSAQMPIEQQQAITLKRIIERTHFSPREVNDSFSLDVFKKLIHSLDPMQLMLTAKEMDHLSAWRNKLDDELNNNGWNFYNQLTSIYGMATRRADSLVNLVLQKPLDLTAADKIGISSDSEEQYAANPTELKQRWTRYFKFRLLNAAYDLSVAQMPKLTLKDAIAKNETVLRQKIGRSMLTFFEKFKDPKGMRELVLETYLISISNCFDPHTMYLSPELNDRFKTDLSKEETSYGFLIGEKDGKTVIMHLIPGGPAWRSGEVHRNDQLLQLSFDNKEFIDATLMEAEEVEEILDETKAKTVNIRIKKGDGSIKTISLRKEKIESEDNSVKSYVLKGSKKVGYISLPDFYTTWENGAGSSCAEDVAREIVNLKKEGIEGLIVDVRYNGGGSMQEAIEMIGIFVNDGPVFAIKTKEKASFLKDPNRGTIWDGPLAILINGQSASASESLAGSLQDLNRAVIVGSSSFGKATMQQIIPMDTTASSNITNSPFGFVKITVGKLYRLGGNTAQLKGVQPDVVLPDAFDVVESGEQHYSHALPADNIKANGYYKPLTPLPVKELAAASTERLSGSQDFARVKTENQKLAAVYKLKKQEVPLQLVAFEKWRTENDALMTNDQPAKSEPSAEFAVQNHQFEKQRIQNNEYASEINNIQLKQLQKDIYIEETYRIVTDLIQKINSK